MAGRNQFGIRRLRRLEPVPKSVFQRAEQLLESFFNASTVGLTILDRKLRYEAVNHTLASMNGVPAEAHVGKTIQQILGDATGLLLPQFQKVFRTRKPVTFEFSAKLPTRADVGYWIENFFPIKDRKGRVTQVGAVVVEITKQKQLEAELRKLSGRLFHVEDAARRRIARDLHDSTGQLLAGLVINLTSIKEAISRLDSKTQAAYIKSVEMAREAAQEVSTVSYLLHPPTLDEFGLADALRWYTQGFAKRSGIAVRLQILRHKKRLGLDLETALFRIVQEGLNNVWKHSNSKRVIVRLAMRRQKLSLEVIDFGTERNRPTPRIVEDTYGVGIAGMRERVQQFGGNLSFHVRRRGTLLRAMVPLGSHEDQRTAKPDVPRARESKKKRTR